MWCAILIFHVLVLRSFISGMIRRERQYFTLTRIDQDDINAAKELNPYGNWTTDEAACEGMYVRACDGQLGHFI